MANTATLAGTGRIAPTGGSGITVAAGGNVAPGGVQTAVGTFTSYTGVSTNTVNGSLTLDTTNITPGGAILSASAGSGLTFAIGAGGPGPVNSTQSVSQLLVTGNVANIMNFNIGGTSGPGGTSTVITIDDLVGTALTLSNGTSASEYVLISGNSSTIYEDNGLTLAAAWETSAPTRRLGQQKSRVG